MSDVGDRPRVVDPDETEYLPNRLYLACRPDDETGDLMLETREAEGQQVVLGYSSLEHFLDGCGPDQPWIVIAAERLVELAREQAAGPAWQPPSFRFGVMLDTPLPPELRGTAGGMADHEGAWDDPTSQDWAMVQVACQSYPQGQAEQARAELQPMPGDRLAMMAYTSASTVEAGCGPYQSTVTIPAGLLGHARREAGADTICLDTPLPPQLRHGPTEGSRQ